MMKVSKQNNRSQTRAFSGPGRPGTHSGHEAVVQAFICKENGVFDEDSTRSQDEGEEQVDVDVVPGAVKLPAEETNHDAETPPERPLWAEPVEDAPISLCCGNELT